MERVWIRVAAGAAGLASLAALVYSGMAHMAFLAMLDGKGRLGKAFMKLALPTTDILKMFKNIPDHVMKEMGESRAWCEKNTPERWNLRSRDGLLLNGWFFKNETPSRRYVIYCHGHGMQARDFFVFTKPLMDQGFSVLLIDARAHGESEGRYRGMGWQDKEDLLDWTDQLLAYDPQAEIMLAGVSMGGTAVLNAAGEPLPPQVKCVVSDCAYAVVRDEIHFVLQTLRFPAGPLTRTVSRMMKRKVGYTPGEASTIEQVKRMSLPVLIFQGDDDDFVPFEHGQLLYDAAAAAEKQFYPVRGAVHGECAILDYEGYMKALFAFADRHLPRLPAVNAIA